VRIAVLADIHGNLPALEAVLDDAAQHAVDRYVVNGDVVNRGPQGVEVLHRLARLEADHTVGNHDDLLLKLADGDEAVPDDFRRSPFWRATRWCAADLAAAGALDALRGWPMAVRIGGAGGGDAKGEPSLLITHGSPRHFREGYGAHLSDAMISEIVEMHPADVLVGSHTHHPLRRRWGRYEVLNTGAVGVPFNGDGRAQYLWLTLVDGAWRPTFRRVAYDRDAALAAYHDRGYLEEGGLLARLFRDETRDARSYVVPFQMWTEANGGSLDEAGFERFRREDPARFGPVAPWPGVTTSETP
jgi:predicted phosphodiesterase